MTIFQSSIIAAAALVFGLGVAAPAQAAGTLYDCTVQQNTGPKGWISPRVAVVLDGAGQAQIIDSITVYFETGPRPARVRRKGDTLKMTWSFSALTDNRSQFIPKLNYWGTLNTETGAFTMRARPSNTPQSIRGVGTCTTRGNLSPKQLNRLLRG